MNIPLSAVGFFGELRPNHFHSGIDFRTEKREGIPIYATADGYISRIKIGINGYGKSLYIDHPNGYTTVYAHLQKCAPNIQEIITKEHYNMKVYEIEILPKPGEIPVKKGDLIAFSGNTGSSSGPHLHFEIRDTKTEKIINPLFFGFGNDVKDTKSPQVMSVIVYPLSKNSQINGNANSQPVNLSLQPDGSYLGATIKASGEIGFSINAHDISNGNINKKGVYKIQTFINGDLNYECEFDSFSFDETKHINTYIDYKRYRTLNQRFQKLFVGKFYPESLVKTIKNKGQLQLQNNTKLNYQIVLQDLHKNKTVVNIPISCETLPIKQPSNEEITPFFIEVEKDCGYSKDGVTVFFPINTFYEDFYLNFNVRNNELYVHDNNIAINNAYGMSFNVLKIPEIEREKMFIGHVDTGGIDYIPTTKNKNFFTIKTKYFGKFILIKDEEAPKIYNPSFTNAQNLDKDSTIKIHISDSSSGIKEYNGYINNKWVLMEYENKKNVLTHNFSDNMFENGTNTFKLEVKDNMGNISTFESTFTKSK